MRDLATTDGDIFLKNIRILNWLLLGVMTFAGWLAFSPLVAKSIFVGSLVGTVGFELLKRDLAGILSGLTHENKKAKKIGFFIKYFARLAALAVLLVFLAKFRLVNLTGLLIGLSAVVLSICIAGAGEAKKLFLIVKEAS
ncbi:MAG: ATP synthase subunit I [Desulfobulbia bacterium]